MDASAAHGQQVVPADRRSGRDRRRTTLASVVYARPYRNRRRGPRRAADRCGYYVDWYEPRLLLVGLAILVLSCADAVLTLLLLDLGAVELNLFMAHLIQRDVALFATAKVAFTAFGVVVLVAHFSFRVFRFVPVRTLLTMVLAGYMALLTHELAMLARLMPPGPPLAG